MSAHPDDPGRLTILRPLDDRRLMAKEYRVASNGRVVRREFSDAKTFCGEVVMLGGIAALHRLLLDLEADPSAFIIRGAPKADTDMTRTPRTVRKGGGAFEDVRRVWMMIDADKVPLPAGASVLADPQDVARHLVDLFAGFAPELEGATAVVQFSASAGIAEMATAEAAADLPERWGSFASSGDTISAHIWYWLAVPADGAALDRWAKTINARIGHKVVDPATLRAVQPHYTAAPIFGAGLRDPLAGRRTVLVRGDRNAVTLDIPAEAPRPALPSGTSATTGIGFAARLAAIGHPEHGFHAPINAAIGAFIAANWPEPNIETLVATLQARIMAADPGARSASEIARYADATNLRARITWTIERQQERDAEERARREANEAVAPTFPDHTVTLAEADRRSAKALAGFEAKLRAGERPRMLLQKTVGSGKSEDVVQGAARLLDAARAGVGEEAQDYALYYLVPRHDLGGEIVERIARAHPGQRVAVWRGMDADDPEASGESMCRDPELPAAAVAAGLSGTAACSACPLQCGYRLQGQQRGNIWVAAHNLASHAKPAALPPVALVVKDEAWWPASLKGLDGPPIQLALSSLEDNRTGGLPRADRERLLYLRHRVARVLRQHEAGGLRRDAFVSDDFTVAIAEEWGQLEWAMQPHPDLRPGIERAAILDRLADAAATGFTRRRPMLARFLRELMASDAHRSVNAEFIPDAGLGGGQGSGPAVRFAWREDFAAWCADAPMLFLDASTAPDVLREWVPDLEVETIEVAASMQHVRQVTDHQFGRQFFTKTPSNVAKLADVVVVELAKAGGGDVLVIAQKWVEDLLRAEMQRRLGDLPASLHTAHFGAITGLDRWRNVARLVVVGRPATNRTTGERLAEIVRGAPIDPVQEGDRNHWPTVTGAIRMADGRGVPVVQPQHPDLLVEALRWSITEGAVLQAIGRPRGVRRTTPVHVTLMAALALPQTVEEVTTWAEIQPDRLEVAAAEAVIVGEALPLAPADLVNAPRSPFITVKAAERYYETRGKTQEAIVGTGFFAEQDVVRYRKPGARRWSLALVPAEHGRSTLEGQVGTLAGYEAVMPEPSAARILVTPEAGSDRLTPQSPPSVSPPEPTPTWRPTRTDRMRLLLLGRRLDAVRPPSGASLILHLPARPDAEVPYAWQGDPPRPAGSSPGPSQIPQSRVRGSHSAFAERQPKPMPLERGWRPLRL